MAPEILKPYISYLHRKDVSTKTADLRSVQMPCYQTTTYTNVQILQEVGSKSLRAILSENGGGGGLIWNSVVGHLQTQNSGVGGFDDLYSGGHG